MAAMIRSVSSRRARPDGTPSYSPATVIGSPTRTVTSTRASRGRLEPTGWMSSVPMQADRDHRAAGGQREVRHSRAAAVEPPVARAGALGVDPERLALAQHLERGVEAGDRGLGVVAVDRQHAEPLEPGPRQRALHAGAGEVVGLGEEDDLARHDHRDHHAVEERQVVAGHDDRAGGRHVVQSLDLWAPHGTGDRRDDAVRDRVEHAAHCARNVGARTPVPGPPTRSAAAGVPSSR